MMKFSEAMRLGAMLRRQAFGSATGVGMEACAMMAAYFGMGVEAEDQPRQMELYYQWRLGRMVKCPAGCCAESAINGIVIHLNDCHRWTREEIADWVSQFDLVPVEPIPVELPVPVEEAEEVCV